MVAEDCLIFPSSLSHILQHSLSRFSGGVRKIEAFRDFFIIN